MTLRSIFQVQEIIERCRVEVLSSNYALYADFSARLMSELAEFSPEVEVYSIDEAFVRLEAGENLLDGIGREIRPPKRLRGDYGKMTRTNECAN